MVAPVVFGDFEDYLLCAISVSNSAADPMSVPYQISSFEEGSLGKPGFVQVRYLFTMDGNQIVRRVAKFGPETKNRIIGNIREWLQPSLGL